MRLPSGALDPSQTGPSLSALLQRALARHPDRTAFVCDGGNLSYRGAADTIGRMQAVFAAAGFGPGTRVARLAANQVEAWCAGMAALAALAALASGMVTTWLHPLGSQDDHLFQRRDFGAQLLVLDAAGFASLQR